MRRVGWASRVWRGSRSQTFGKVVAASTAGAVLIAVAAAGTTEAIAAAPDANNALDRVLKAQSTGAATSSTPDQLSVTVGKAVSITTDATGTPSLKAFVTNTQVSGQGSGKLYVPVGTNSPTNTSGFGGLQVENDSIVYNIDSTSSEVQNLHASGGVYSEQPAVSLQIKAWLDGQEVSADSLYNVTGNVKLEYTFTNNTAKNMPITYKNSAGKMVTQDMEIPVPMGASFGATFGNGWGDIKAPWALTGISPTGQQLNGTVILFPPLGASKKTLTVEARAQNATLPQSQTTAIPINLGTYSGGILLTALPAGEAAAGQISGLAGTAAQKLVFYQQMLAKYANVVAELDKNQVKPLVNAVDSIKINSKEISSAITLLTAAVDIAGLYMEANAAIAEVDQIIAGGMAKAFRAGASVAESLEAGLNAAKTDLNKAASEIKLIAGLINSEIVQDALKALDVIVGADLLAACSALKVVRGVYNGYNIGGTIPQFLTDAGLTDLKTKLDAQNLPGNAGLDAALANCNENNSFLTGLIKRFIDPQTGLGELLDELADALDALAAPGGILADGAALAGLMADNLPLWAKKLDNPNCPNNIKQANINNCGVKQIAALTEAGNVRVANMLFDDLAPFVESLKAYIPGIIKLEGEVKGLVDIIGGAVEAVPGELDKFAGLLGGIVPIAGNAEKMTANLEDKLAIMNASMVAMNNRAVAGDGSPYGNATGVGNPQTLAAWQINQSAANRNTTQDIYNLCAALLLFVIGAGVGTALYVRRPH